MAKKLVYVILVVLAFTLQDTWVPLWSVRGAMPDLLMFFVVFTGLLKGPLWGLVTGIVLGLIQDLLSGKYLGLNILAKGVTGFTVPLICAKFYKDNYLIPLLAIVAGTLISGLVFIICGNIAGLELPFMATLWDVYLPQCIFNCVLTPFIYVAVYLYFIQYESAKEQV